MPGARSLLANSFVAIVADRRGAAIFSRGLNFNEEERPRATPPFSRN
jgi:hypothetical protein